MKKIIILLQIILLINFVPASIYDFYQQDIMQGTYKANYNEYFQYQEKMECCTEMENGAICQNVPQGFKECAGDIIPEECEKSGPCKIGCCIDSKQGFCNPNTAVSTCETGEGTWNPRSDCAIPECQKGCCNLGQDIDWMTERRCEVLSSLSGAPFNFEQNMNMIECFELKKKQKEGACLLLENVCVFTTEVECARLEGNFNHKLLCSNVALKTGCQPQDSISCIEGEDELYWFDSCGNKENIYDLNKERSYNNGTVLEKFESCGASLSNVNSETCGNCDRTKGSKCMPSKVPQVKDGEYACTPLNCLDKNKVLRKNGESWCEYDGKVGDSKDVVGSRHFRNICYEGEIIIEPCADYRQEICAEETRTEEGETRNYAVCRTNRWKNCLSGKDCNNDADCQSKSIKIGDTSIQVCVPNYPPGFDFWQKSKALNKGASEICSYANQKCTVVYVKPPFGSWDCEANCQCETAAFTKDMHDFCTSLGDCGSYPNINGQMGGGYSVKNAPKISTSGLAQYAQYIANQHVPLGTAVEYNELFDLDRENELEGDASSPKLLNTGQIMVSTYFLTFAILPFLYILNFFFKGKTKKIIVDFKCQPWRAPSGGNQCDTCNDNPDKPCSQYRCKSLGAACELTNIFYQYPTCFEGNPNDRNPPIISFGSLDKEYTFTKEENGIFIKKENGDCITEFAPLEFMLKTDEYAQCRFEFNRTENYDSMENYLGNTGLFLKNHTSIIALPSIGSPLIKDLTGDAKEKEGIFEIFIRCSDTHGNSNLNEFVVKTCIQNGPDITPAILTASSINQESFSAYKQKTKEITFWTNEPADCRWSIESKNYELMENQANCSNEMDQIEDFGWKCETEFTGINEGENNFYVRCKDQPWLPETNTSRNTNVEDFKFEIHSSSTPLTITEISPMGLITQGYVPATIDLSSKTSGGAQQGWARCKYQLNSQEGGYFEETGMNKHTQMLDQINSIKYNVTVECEDLAGNKARNESLFEIEVDKKAPVIGRMFSDNGMLHLVTNEKALCYNDFDSCLYDTNTKEALTGVYSTSHLIEWNHGLTYHIKCEDIWGNKINGCTTKVLSSFF